MMIRPLRSLTFGLQTMEAALPLASTRSVRGLRFCLPRLHRFCTVSAPNSAGRRVRPLYPNHLPQPSASVVQFCLPSRFGTSSLGTLPSKKHPQTVKKR